MNFRYRSISAALLPAILVCGCTQTSQQAQPDLSVDGAAMQLQVTSDGVVEVPVMLKEALQKAGDRTVLVDFRADWCGPCQMLSPELKALKQRHADDLEVLAIDVDAEPSLAEHFGVRSIPDIRVFRNGEVVDQWIGFHSADELEAKLP